MHVKLYYHEYLNKSVRYLIEITDLEVSFGRIDEQRESKIFDNAEERGKFTEKLTKQYINRYALICHEELDENGQVIDRWVAGQQRIDEEDIPAEAEKRLTAALSDSKKISAYLKFCNSIDIELYEDRYCFGDTETGHIPQLFKKWGFDKDNLTVMDLLAAQMLYDDYQFVQDDCQSLQKIGLSDAIENADFVKALLKHLKKRSQYLIDKHFTSKGFLAQEIDKLCGYLNIDLKDHKAFSKYVDLLRN